ncbi:hemicentin-1-like [Haliotis rufescens]|uniref:hemicentin-1-like n=1 Tax=Haliotis rufescens TaxID=6454 RepID=UPI00201F5947|nr:hemicentin-1-like [Haliotis rufescens]
MDRRIPVANLSLALNCSLDSSSPSEVEFELNATVVGTCQLNTGACNSTDAGYSLITSAGSAVSLTIQSFQAGQDYGDWTCRHGSATDQIYIQTSSGLLQWSSVTTNPTQSNIPSSLNSTSSLTIALSIPCVKGQANVSWTYTTDVGMGGPLNALYSSSSCGGTSVVTSSSVTVVGNNQDMKNKSVTLRVHVEHDSFDPAKDYTETKDFGPVQFPGGVTSVTLVNITRDSESIHILDGSSLVLICETSKSFPTASVNWYRNGSQNVTSQSVQRQEGTSVKKKTISTLTYPVTPVDNTGLFSCRASNSQSSVSSFNAKLNVVYSPSRPTLNVSPSAGVLEERTVTLTCVSSNQGNPECIYRWKKNGVDVLHQGSTWTFTSGRLDNGANITCLAENEYTNSTSTEMTSAPNILNVYYRPNVTVSGASTKTEGETLHLTCSADSNPGGPSFTWTYNSITVSNTNTHVANITREYQGVYRCTARVNAPGYGSLEGNSSTTVTVNYPPDITMSGVTLTEGRTLTLVCRASGQPATYTFFDYKQYWGNTLVNSYRGTHAGPTYTLQKAGVTYRDSGEYECSVYNSITSTETKRVTVTVNAAPEFLSSSSPTLAIGANVTLSWTLVSKPSLPGITWYHGNQTPSYPTPAVTSINVAMNVYGRQVVDEGYQVQIPLLNVQPSQLGRYTITACNSIDCRNSSLSLHASGPPLVPLEFSAINSSSESVWLRWKPNFPGGTFIQSFILKYRVMPGGNWTFETVPQGTGPYTHKRVVGLEPDTEYAFKVQSRNNRWSNFLGEETHEVFQKTKDAWSPAALGTGVGIGIAACVGLALLAAVPLLVLKFRAHIPRISRPFPIKANSPRYVHCP